MSAFSDAQLALIEIFKAAVETAQRLESTAVAAKLSREAERLADAQHFVVVCGEFKSGKSSLINAMLDTTDLVPIGTDIATSTIILVRHGQTPRAVVFPGPTAANPHPQPQEIGVGDISRYADAQALDKGASPPRSILIELPHPKLAGGVTFVDTPGIGSLDRSHSEMTFAALADASIVLFVSRATRPLTTEQLQFIESRVLPIARNVIMVQTHADQTPDTAQIERDTQSKIEPLLDKGAAALPVLFVSNKLKLDWQLSRSQADLEESGFPALDGWIQSLISISGETTIIDRAKGVIVECLRQLAEPIVMELDALEKRGPQALAELRGRLDAADEQLSQMHSGDAHWRTELAHGLSDMRRRVVEHRFKSRVTKLQYGISRLVEDREAAPGRAATALYDDLCVLVIECQRDLEGEVEELRQKLRRITRLPLEQISASLDRSSVSEPDIQMEREQVGLIKYSTEVGMGLRRQAIGGALVGGLLGIAAGAAAAVLTGGVAVAVAAVAGLKVGTASGGVGFGILGLKDAIREAEWSLDAPTRRKLLASLQEYFAVSINDVNALLSGAIIDIERRFNTELQQRIADKRLEVVRTRKAIETDLTRSEEETLARMMVLRRYKDEIDQLGDRTKALTVGRAVTKRAG